MYVCVNIIIIPVLHMDISVQLVANVIMCTDHCIGNSPYLNAKRLQLQLNVDIGITLKRSNDFL